MRTQYPRTPVFVAPNATERSHDTAIVGQLARTDFLYVGRLTDGKRPGLLLSGFAFPFRGMPGWAQTIGELLPVTHFLRIVRGLMLKGASLQQVAAELAVLALMLVIVSSLAISRYRVTLD